jgi:hypothetical protein
VVDDVVEVTAVASVPGVSGVSDGDVIDTCTWRLVMTDDLVRGVYSPDGIRAYSDTGRWFQRECDGEVVAVNGFFVVPEGGGFLIGDLLEQALDALDPAAPTWGAAPDGDQVPMVVQMPTWLWVDSAYWDGTFAARAVTPSGRMWAEARGHPATATWEPGDGAAVVCTSAGEPWNDGAGSKPTCSHTYRHSTAASGPLALTVTVAFEVDGITSIDPNPVPLGSISRTSAPAAVTVGEIQAIETSGA